MNNTFTWTMHDQARHGGAYIRLYVTRQGFDPVTQRLSWSDLELVKDTGPFPDTGWPTTTDPILNGVSYSFQISAPGRTGRHIVYAVWRAGHADQNYYMCSDVRFPGGAPDPQQPGPGPVDPDNGCTATYSVTGQWGDGFQADVKVTAANTAIRGWQVTMQFLDGQTVGQSWNADFTSNGSRVTARNVGYNANLAPGASTTFGILGTWLSTNRAPSMSCTAVT